ncbi:hypothetical protein [Reyranella sp.]|uniref:hypothetical protein n=1 Tax=Reyranella sp. TaxID=1929291 RepID=UPI003D0DCA6C
MGTVPYAPSYRPAGPCGNCITPACAVAISAGQLTLNLSGCDFFLVPVDADIAGITVRNAPRGIAFMIEFTADGTARAQTWPWTWLTGTPVLSTADGKRDLAVVWTIDGVAFFAAMIAQAY